MMIYYNHGLAILIFLWALFSSTFNADITTPTSITTTNEDPINVSIESISPSTATSNQTSTENPQNVIEMPSENVESTEVSNLDTTKTATSSQTSTENPQDVTELPSENVESTEVSNLDTTKKANEFVEIELLEARTTSAPVTTTKASKTNENTLNSVTKKMSETSTAKSTTPTSTSLMHTTEASSGSGDGSGSGSGEGSGSGSSDSGTGATEKLPETSKTSAPVTTTKASKTNETTLNSVTKKMGETSTTKSTTPKSKNTTEASSGSGDGSGSGSGEGSGSGSGSGSDDSGSSDSGTTHSGGGNSASTTSTASTAATTTSDNGAGKKMAFGALMVISLFFMILQIWSSILGHRMQLHPVRWHTLHYNCWNIFQLVVFADTDTYSPYAGFLHNSNIDTGLNNLQKLTFTAFMSSWIVVTPFILISYYLPNILKNRFTQWIIWIPIYTILNIIPIAFCFAGNFMDPGNDLFNAYHMGITGLFVILLLVSIVFTIVSLVVFIVHSIMYCTNTREHSTKFLPHAYDFLHLLFKLIYYIVSFYTIMPYNSKTMVEYLTRVIGMMTLVNWMNWALTNFANLMPTLIDLFQSLLNQAAWCALMIPIGEFFTTFLWIEMYREQYIWLLSCGRFYKDKIGQKITKQPIRGTTMVVQPKQTGLVAKPGAVAPRNGGWTDPVLQGALNTDPNARFIPVSNTAPLQQNWTSNGQDSKKGNNSFSSTASLISNNSTKKID